jgi:Oxidoreductase family, NAD-binding Rossmann fold/Oxidoreductase family, C-terminal alpha/beta domain
MKQENKISRRKFVGTTVAATAFTIVPSNVLGGLRHTAPSDQLNIAYIGCGTQGIREMTELLKNEDIRITSVCDPNKFSTNYVDWSLNGIRNMIRRTLDDPNWGSGLDGIPGGRDVGKELVEKYYAKQSGSGTYKGCRSYNDYRELLEKETGIDAVKIMTPDHLHAAVSIASMKKGKHVVIHKPIANRMKEAMRTIETARQTGISSHLLAWSERSGLDVAKEWIREGAIGKLKEIHNWSNRPVWPQWTSNPDEKVAIPDNFDWQLWLGPVPDRDYHPNYTNAVFRGWYDFGAGSIADMGHYSLWPLFLQFGINTAPLSARANGTTTCMVENHVSKGVKNDVAFPYSCVVEFDFPAQETLPPFKLYWYDGGMKPQTPPELDADNKDLPREGMMFVGEEGKILAGFRGERPKIIPEKRMLELTGSAEPPREITNRNDRAWIEAFKNSKESPGTFLKAAPVTQTILLGGVALRAGKKVVYDSEKIEISNKPDANQYLTREYREGWEI